MALLLREDGFICDDGVVGRLAADRFHVTTTTGGAAARAGHDGGLSADRMARSRRLADLVTEQWAVIAVQGPSAREGSRRSSRTSISPPPPCRIWRSAKAASAASRPASSASASQANSASRSTSRPITAAPCGRP